MIQLCLFTNVIDHFQAFLLLLLLFQMMSVCVREKAAAVARMFTLWTTLPSSSMVLQGIYVEDMMYSILLWENFLSDVICDLSPDWTYKQTNVYLLTLFDDRPGFRIYVAKYTPDAVALWMYDIQDTKKSGAMSAST